MAIIGAPPILFVLGFKWALNRKFGDRFHWVRISPDFGRSADEHVQYLPDAAEVASSRAHASDERKGRLAKRFGHPSLHTPLFTPMVYALSLIDAFGSDNGTQAQEGGASARERILWSHRAHFIGQRTDINAWQRCCRRRPYFCCYCSSALTSFGGLSALLTLTAERSGAHSGRLLATTAGRCLGDRIHGVYCYQRL